MGKRYNSFIMAKHVSEEGLRQPLTLKVTQDIKITNKSDKDGEKFKCVLSSPSEDLLSNTLIIGVQKNCLKYIHISSLSLSLSEHLKYTFYVRWSGEEAYFSFYKD